MSAVSEASAQAERDLSLLKKTLERAPAWRVTGANCWRDADFKGWFATNGLMELGPYTTHGEAESVVSALNKVGGTPVLDAVEHHRRLKESAAGARALITSEEARITLTVASADGTINHVFDISKSKIPKQNESYLLLMIENCVYAAREAAIKKHIDGRTD